MEIKEQREEYLHRLEFEHDLIHRRITWLLVSQTILYAAYGLAAKGDGCKIPDLFFKVIASSGLAVSILVLVGVTAAALANYFAWKKYIDESGDKGEAFGGIKTWITIVGFVPDFFLPVVFMVGWSVILSLPV